MESSSATPPTNPTAEDASDCVDLAAEATARFELMQRHEEAPYVPRQQYDDNIAELRVILDALTAYVIVPKAAVRAW